MAPDARQHADVLKHIFENVLKLDDNTPVVRMLKNEGLVSINDLLPVRRGELDGALDPGPGDTTGQPVPLFQIKRMYVFIEFVAFLNGSRNPIGDNWLSITSEEFDLFRLQGIDAFNPQRTSYVTASNTTLGSFKMPVAEMFRRGLKRDQKLSPIPTEEGKKESWQCTLVPQVASSEVTVRKSGLIRDSVDLTQQTFEKSDDTCFQLHI